VSATTIAPTQPEVLICRLCSRAVDEFAPGRTICLPCKRRRDLDYKHNRPTGPVIPASPDPAPAVRLRLMLDRWRREGWPFDRAWRAALIVALAGLPKVPRREWREALAETEPIWRAAYIGESLAVTDAMSVLAVAATE
jgi:hypothetical protein